MSTGKRFLETNKKLFESDEVQRLPCIKEFSTKVMITAGLPGKAKESKPHFNSELEIELCQTQVLAGGKRKEETKKKKNNL